MHIKAGILLKIDKNKVRNLRLSKGISMRKLSQELDVSHTSIHYIEQKNERAISMELVLRYCDYFKVPIMDILTSESAKQCVSQMTDYLEFHDVIDPGTAESIKNFYSKG